MTEPLVSARLRRDLADCFWLVPEVEIRDPAWGYDFRIDYVAIPKIDTFPFDHVGIEVKRADCSGSDFYQALKQCGDYTRCVVVDPRAERLFGLNLRAVFLFRDRTRTVGADTRQNELEVERRGAVRAVGKQNVGELVRDDKLGLTFEISDTALWTIGRGVTGAGRTWPGARRVGNSRRRAA